MSNNDSLPLRERRVDWFFIIMFSIFAFTSFAADAVNGVARPSADSGYFWARAVYDLYAVGNDPLLIANPIYLRVMTFISAFVFGPFYIVLVYSFIRGINRIRPAALIYVGMIVESMIILIVAEFHGDAAFLNMMCECGVKSADELARSGLTPDLTVQDPLKFLAFNLPYKLVPILLGVRMWKPNPFGRKRSE